MESDSQHESISHTKVSEGYHLDLDCWYGDAIDKCQRAFCGLEYELHNGNSSLR